MNFATLLTIGEIEQAARAVVDAAVWTYINGGAGANKTVHSNVTALEQISLRPRIRDVASVSLDTSVSLFGKRVELPVLLAPTSPQRLLHEDAELATARAAVRAGTITIVSTDSHYSFETIAQSVKQSCWFQLYAYGSRRDVEATLEMAARAGAEAVVVTMDAHYSARRIAAKRAGFRTPPQVDFGTLRALGILPGNIPPDARFDRIPLTWSDLEWIRAQVAVPLLVKGVLHPDDARRCVQIGADGIIVSNHGGRQLDCVISSVAALEDISIAVGSECVVLMDGGIRSGVDVIKALALGAQAVCIGRPYLWGLALEGEGGVTAVLELLRNEVEDTLLQLGVNGLADITASCVSQGTWNLSAPTEVYSRAR